MNESMVDRLDDQEPLPEPLEIPHPRAVGSPLPRGNGVRVPLPPNYDDLERNAPVQQPGVIPGPALGPVLAPPPASAAGTGSVPTPPSPPAHTAAPLRRELPPPAGPRTGLQRAVGMVRSALPIVQKLLPLLEGNIASAVSNVLAPTPAPRPPAPPPVDLSPIQNSITELQSKHRDLRDQVSEQNTSLKRVEDRLEMVREATDRNTLEQQELLSDLKSMGNRVNLVAAIAIGLLLISLLVNLALFRHIQQVLP